MSCFLFLVTQGEFRSVTCFVLFFSIMVFLSWSAIFFRSVLMFISFAFSNITERNLIFYIYPDNSVLFNKVIIIISMKT